MKNKDLGKLEFITSLITAVLVGLLAYLQYSKGRNLWWLIMIVAILMFLNAYVKYKNYKKREEN